MHQWHLGFARLPAYIFSGDLSTRYSVVCDSISFPKPGFCSQTAKIYKKKTYKRRYSGNATVTKHSSSIGRIVFPFMITFGLTVPRPILLIAHRYRKKKRLGTNNDKTNDTYIITKTRLYNFDPFNPTFI